MKHITQGKRALAVMFTLLFALGAVMPAFAEGEYPQMNVSINDVGAPVCPPDTTASVTVSGGSGSFSYQWYYASSVKEGGAVSSPSKGGTAACEITVAETPKPSFIGGSGSVTLQLSTTSKASCFKLYPASNTKGTPLRQVYLAANSAGSMSFDPGRYVLKIASGTAWLGEEQAFGKSGIYSQSDAYDFTPGTYGIETSTTHGDFRSSSMSGFVG
ncbi:MAG: hypothetical protein Q4E65_07370 [Clostridia bacterium]|nr:hypothetical protein [Clostridia bacterium]